MDKITRIHLAKIPYEISITAQAELKKYFDAIRQELDENLADETLSDIEVRITEILSERKVKRNDVITATDIKAIQQQLGTPEQFIDSDDIGHQVDAQPGDTKRLLRNPDGAYVAGVASGLGAYFTIDPIFFRILFVILTFFYGLGLLLYVLFWLLVPEAKSSSDKLQMNGQPVTVATLQTYRSGIQRKLGEKPNPIQQLIMISFTLCKKILKVVGTVWATLICLYLLAVVGILSSLTFVYPFRSLFISYGIDYVALSLVWLIALALIGLLVSFVMRLWGNRSSHLKISAISLLTVLVIALAGAGATAVVVYNHFSDEYGNGKVTTALAMSSTSPISIPTKLDVNSDANLNLTYVITNQAIHATYQAYPGLGKPDMTITNSHGVLSINSSNLSQAAPSCLGSLCQHIYLPIHVTLYGPPLGTISDNSGAELSINNANLGKTVSLDAYHGSTINVNNSYAKTMNITATSGANVQINNSSAQQTNVRVDMSSSVIAPYTTNLTATLPSNCNQNGAQVLYLNGYSGHITLNGQLQSANDLNQSSCVNSGF